MALTEPRVLPLPPLPDAEASVTRTLAAPPRRRGGWRVLGLFASGLLLLQLAWTIAFPPFWGMDEPDHAFRAASVAAGHWQPSTVSADPNEARGEMVRVPTDLAWSAAAVCLLHPWSQPGNCMPMGAERNGTVPIATAAGRYNPVYYAVAGTVARPFHGNAALYAMRVATAVWSALLLTAALWALLTWARTRWPFTVLLLACTPQVLYSTAVAAPNGVHLAASITLWASLVGLLRRPDPGPTRTGLAVLTAVSGVTALWTHSLALMWVPLIVAASFGLVGRGSWRRALDRDVQRPLLVIVAAYVASGVWVLMARTNDPMAQPHVILMRSAWAYVERGLLLWPLQATAAFPDRKDSAPPLIYGIWLVAVIMLLVLAWPRLRASAHRLEALTLGAIVLTSFTVPTVLTLATVHRIGGAWQGRYGYPLAVGFFFGLALLLDRSVSDRGRLARVLMVMPALFVLANVVGQVHVLEKTRRVHGMVRAASWHVAPVWLFLAVGLVSVVLLTAAFLREPDASAPAA